MRHQGADEPEYQPLTETHASFLVPESGFDGATAAVGDDEQVAGGETVDAPLEAPQTVHSRCLRLGDRSQSHDLVGFRHIGR